jgi:hypothetical protein
MSLPPIAIDIPLVICDALLKSQSITSSGVELVLRSPHRKSWFAQIVFGGIAGSASAFTQSTLNLWSTNGWGLTAEDLSPLAWDLYGPFVLAAIHVALRGCHPSVNNVSAVLTGAAWGLKGTRYLNANDARTIIAIIYTTVVVLKRLGIYTFQIGQKSSAGRRVMNSSRKLR